MFTFCARKQGTLGKFLIDDIAGSDSQKELLEKTSAIFATSLSFDFITFTFLGTEPSVTDEDEFQSTFEYCLKEAFDELKWEQKSLVKIVEGLKDKTFSRFQDEWKNTKNQQLLANTAKSGRFKQAMLTVEKNMRTLRCLETGPHRTWSQEGNLQRQHIETAMQVLEQEATTQARNVMKAWGSLARESGSNNEAFRIDAYDLLISVTRELRVRNKSKSGITFIYLIMQGKNPILTSYRNGVFGLLALDKEPHAWKFRREENILDEIKPIFAANEDLDSEIITTTLALGITLNII